MQLWTVCTYVRMYKLYATEVPCESLSLTKQGRAGPLELCYAMFVNLCLELDDVQSHLDVLHQTWFLLHTFFGILFTFFE
jgi:hypothetical protein